MLTILLLKFTAFYVTLSRDSLPNTVVTGARVALVVQNVSVALSAVAVCVLVLYPDAVDEVWDGWLRNVLEGGVILFAVLADLGSVARTISVERDWIVVICRDEQKLTGQRVIGVLGELLVFLGTTGWKNGGGGGVYCIIVNYISHFEFLLCELPQNEPQVHIR